MRHSDGLNSYSDSVIVDSGPPPLEYKLIGTTTTSYKKNNNLADPYLPIMLDETKQNLGETFTTLLRLQNDAFAGVLKNHAFAMLLFWGILHKISKGGPFLPSYNFRP